MMPFGRSSCGWIKGARPSSNRSEGDDASAVESRAPALRSAIGQRRVTR